MISAICLIVGIFYTYQDKASIYGRGLMFLLTSYGIISSSVFILTLTIWHIHPLWEHWIHLHPESYLSNIILFSIGKFKIDMLTLSVLFFTSLVYLTAILYSQIKLRSLYLEMKRCNIPHLSLKLSSEYQFLNGAKLFIIEDTNPRAFSFSRIAGFLPRVIDCIVLSTGILEHLEIDEIEGVLAHEYSHCKNHDTRYAHLIVTIRSLLQIDPILKKLENKLNKDQELHADDGAVSITRKPKSLASALFKILEFEFKINNGYSQFVSGSSSLLIFRIERLLSYKLKPHHDIPLKNSNLESETSILSIEQ